MSTAQMVDLMCSEDEQVLKAVRKAKPEVVRLIEAVEVALIKKGRLIYVGAGTSGRLGMLDAAECPPTFSVEPNRIIGVLAGGEEAMTQAVEGAEDVEASGQVAIQRLNVGPDDVVLGITASGQTPYVLGALKEAHRQKAKIALLASHPHADIKSNLHFFIPLDTGPEIIAGSTRLKAGTATKIILNQISTLAWVKLGKTYKNLMVDVKVSNTKLYKRALHILEQLTGCERKASKDMLARAGGSVKLALVMHLKELDSQEAQHVLKQAGGILSRILD